MTHWTPTESDAPDDGHRQVERYVGPFHLIVTGRDAFEAAVYGGARAPRESADHATLEAAQKAAEAMALEMALEVAALAPTFAEQLVVLRACPEARQWVGDKRLDVAWTECPRGDWLLWLAERVGVDRRTLVLAACDCARTVLHLVRADEDRPRLAIETAERWARGEATLEEVRAADADAYAAYDAAYAGAAAAAAAAAAYAADDDAAAAAAASAAAAAYAAAAAAAYDAAYAAGGAQCADLVRARITWQDVSAAYRAGSLS